MPGRTSLAAVVVLAASVVARPALPASAFPADAHPTSTRPPLTSPAGTAASPTAASSVTVAFDSPGARPRPIKETTVAIPDGTQVLRMAVVKITYPGLACGYSFRGTRPASPVVIRMQGRAAGKPFDSGDLAVPWTPTSRTDTPLAGASTDRAARWNFVAEAHVNRTGPGWVVSLTGLASGQSPDPSGATCTLTAATRAGFAAANGPVGYWSGFATT